MTGLLYIFLLVIISGGIGKRLISRFVQGLSRLERCVFSVGLGTGILAYVVLILGSAGLLYFNLVILALLVFCICFYRDIAGFANDLLSIAKGSDLKKTSLFEKILLTILFLAFLFSLCGALAPPTGNDALAYHLQHPKIFVQQNAVKYIPYTRESLWPYLTEMLFTLGMVLKGPVLAKLFHYLFGLLSTFGVFCIARRYADRKTGILASVLFYLSPGIFMQASYAYVDLALCFYILCSLYLFLLWRADKEKVKILFAGIFMGLAFSVKVLAGMALIPLFVLLIWELTRNRQKPGEKILSLMLFIGPAILISSIWYIRSFLETGNPVYPFLSGLFGAGWPTQIGTEVGYVKGFAGFFRLPWDLVMHVKMFGGEQIGFLFLAFLPCCFFVDWRNVINRYMAVFAVVYASVWFIVDPNIRFLFPVFPVIFIFIAFGLKNLWDRGYASLKVLAVLGLSFNLALAFYYNAGAIKLISGKISEEQYLTQTERTYEIALWANDNIRHDDLLIIAGEPRLLFFEMPTLEYRVIERISGGDEEKAAKMLAQEEASYKKVYLLVSGHFADHVINNRVKSKKPVFQTSFLDDGRQISYSIFQLK